MTLPPNFHHASVTASSLSQRQHHLHPPTTSTALSNTTPTTSSAILEPLAVHGQLSAPFSTNSTTRRVPTSTPDVRLQNTEPTPAPTRPQRQDFATAADFAVATHGRQTSMYQTQQQQLYSGMGGGPAVSRGIKRARSHQRSSSASTVASNGPASPFQPHPSGSYPHIANADQSPNSSSFYPADQAFAKNLPTPSHTPTESSFATALYMPSQAAHIPNAHLAMKDFGIGHHNSEDFAPDIAPSRQSMSSYGNDSPATPQSGAGDNDGKQYSLPQNGEIGATQAFGGVDYLLFDAADYSRQPNPNVQLFRTESQAYQDELYNPNVVYNSAPTKPNPSYLAPHRNMLSERLQTANMIRSTSPTSAVSRDRSPFRDGSPHAPSKDWRMSDGRVGTAASMRQQQRDEAANAEYAQHRVPLRREATKTISPKDAVLEYHDSDQPSLFQDSIPMGYEKHLGGTEQWPTNNYITQSAGALGELPNGQHNMGFRNATSAGTGISATAFDFATHGGLPLQGASSQIQSNPFQSNYQAAVAAKMNSFDPTPDFPATIPSMETSHSDAGFPASSQDSNGNTSAPQRPDDTRANTGTYTCTYHGCTQRFESHSYLQKHKRDFHRAQQQQLRDGASASGTESLSPRSSESPGPSTNGMTSAQILARNSQAGPHKCTRINPSTGKPCNTIFSRPYDLTRHEDTIHNNRKQKVRCPMCREEKTFSRNDALTRHMRVVHPEVESFGKRGRRSD